MSVLERDEIQKNLKIQQTQLIKSEYFEWGVKYYHYLVNNGEREASFYWLRRLSEEVEGRVHLSEKKYYPIVLSLLAQRFEQQGRYKDYQEVINNLLSFFYTRKNCFAGYQILQQTQSQWGKRPWHLKYTILFNIVSNDGSALGQNLLSFLRRFQQGDYQHDELQMLSYEIKDKYFLLEETLALKEFVLRMYLLELTEYLRYRAHENVTTQAQYRQSKIIQALIEGLITNKDGLTFLILCGEFYLILNRQLEVQKVKNLVAERFVVTKEQIAAGGKQAQVEEVKSFLKKVDGIKEQNIDSEQSGKPAIILHSEEEETILLQQNMSQGDVAPVIDLPQSMGPRERLEKIFKSEDNLRRNLLSRDWDKAKGDLEKLFELDPQNFLAETYLHYLSPSKEGAEQSLGDWSHRSSLNSSELSRSEEFLFHKVHCSLLMNWNQQDFFARISDFASAFLTFRLFKTAEWVLDQWEEKIMRRRRIKELDGSDEDDEGLTDLIEVFSWRVMILSEQEKWNQLVYYCQHVIDDWELTSEELDFFLKSMVRAQKKMAGQ